MADLDKKEYEKDEVELNKAINKDQIEGLEVYYKNEEVFTGKYNHDGKKIYRQVIGDFGALPTSAEKTYELATDSIHELVTLTATYTVSGATYTNRNTGSSGVNIIDWYIFTSNPRVVCSSDFDASNRTAQTIVVEYTK